MKGLSESMMEGAISDDKQNDFQTLLENPNQLTIHQRNLQVLMIEVYKKLDENGPQIVENLFVFRENLHNIKNVQVTSNKKINTVGCGPEIIYHRPPFL